MKRIIMCTLAALSCGEAGASAPGAQPPPIVIVALDASAEATRIGDASAVSVAAGAAGAADAATDAPVTVSPCVFSDVTLRPIVSSCTEHVDAADVAQPRDVESKLVAPASPVAPGARVALELRYTNATSAPLRLRFDRGLRASLVTVDAAGRTIDPPPGSPKILPDPTCDTRLCPNMTPAVIVLAPGGTARVPVLWIAEKKAWPPPARIPCCTVAPGPIVGAGALAPGTYRVSVSGPLQANVAQAEAEIAVAN